MFKLLLKSYKLKYEIKDYIIKKLNKKKSINKYIYDEVIKIFIDDINKRIYINEKHLEKIVQELRNDWTPVNPVHMNFLINDLHNYLKFKLLLCNNVKIERTSYDDLESLIIFYEK